MVLLDLHKIAKSEKAEAVKKLAIRLVNKLSRPVARRG